MKTHVEPNYVSSLVNEIIMKYTQRGYQGSLKIQNIFKTNTVIFRLRTNAPKHYVVKPTASILNPGEIMEIMIYMKPNSNAGERRKDKFQIHAIMSDIYINDSAKPDSKIITEYFRKIEDIKKNEIQTITLPINIHFQMNQQLQPPTTNQNNSIYEVDQVYNDTRMSMLSPKSFVSASLNDSALMNKSSQLENSLINLNDEYNLSMRSEKKIENTSLRIPSIKSLNNSATATPKLKKLVFDKNARLNQSLRLLESSSNNILNASIFSNQSTQNKALLSDMRSSKDNDSLKSTNKLELSDEDKRYNDQIIILKAKFEEYQKQIKELKEQKDNKLDELAKLKIKLDHIEPIPIENDNPSTKSIQIWHMFLICMIFLVLGNLVRN